MKQKIQKCANCGDPTEKCEEDGYQDDDGEWLCERCWDELMNSEQARFVDEKLSYEEDGQ